MDVVNTHVMIWFCLAFALLATEIFTLSFILICFAMGAVIAGLVATQTDSLVCQLATFSVVCIVMIFVLKSHIMKWMFGKSSTAQEADLDITGYVNSRVVVDEDFVNGSGEVKLNGAIWDGDSSHPFRKGDLALVESVNGIRLNIKTLE